MKLIICGVLLALSLCAQSSEFVVEKLTATELAAYKEAVAHLQEVERKIKAGHGEQYGYSSVVTADCGPKYSRTVEIKGDYALIDINVFYPCSGGFDAPVIPFPK